MRSLPSVRDIAAVFLLTFAALLIHGYHYAHQDGAIYVPALQKALDPSLFPLDASFFLSQTRWMLFTELVAASIRLAGMSVEWAVLGWHLLNVFVVLLASLFLARRIFTTRRSQWAAVLALCSALHMPEAGTGLNIMDRHLHPRDLATAASLFAFVALLERRPRAFVWLALGGLMHPTMTAYNAFHISGQFLTRKNVKWFALFAVAIAACASALARAVANSAWHEILSTRRYLYPLRWYWFEWLGVVVPFAMLIWFVRLARRHNQPAAGEVARRILWSGGLGILGAVLLSVIPLFERLVPAEPMRIIHFFYVLWVFLCGGLLGEIVLRNRPVRWLICFGAIALTFFLTDRIPYAASPHIEWPGTTTKNSWVEAFDWARRNTPPDAIFALHPNYMNLPGEDAHGFRAFAQRTVLADSVKDRAVAGLEPDLAYQWRMEITARSRWPDFTARDFQRLRQQFHVSWVVLERASLRHDPADLHLICPFRNSAVFLCRIPESDEPLSPPAP